MARLVLPPHGSNAAVAAMITTPVTRHLAAAQHHGLGIVVDALTTETAAVVVTTMVAIMTTATAPRHHHHLSVLLLGNQLPHLPPLAQATADTVATQPQDTALVTLLSKRWVLLLGLAHQAVLHLLQVLLLDLTLSWRNMAEALLRLLRLEARHLHLLLVLLLHLLHQAINHRHHHQAIRLSTSSSRDTGTTNMSHR